MITGTCYFHDIVDARRYYARMGFNARDVDRKIQDGEIHVGEIPAIPEGGKRWLNDENRWMIQDAEISK